MKVLSQGLLDLKKKKKTVSERTFNYYNIRSKNQAQKKSTTDYNHFLRHFCRVQLSSILGQQKQYCCQQIFDSSKVCFLFVFYLYPRKSSNPSSSWISQNLHLCISQSSQQECLWHRISFVSLVVEKSNTLKVVLRNLFLSLQEIHMQFSRIPQ